MIISVELSVERLSTIKPMSRSRTVWVGWLLGMLVLLQTLGLVHRVVHAHAWVASAASQNTSLFDAHEAGSVQCQLFDQLSQADCVDFLPPACLLISATFDPYTSPGTLPLRATLRQFRARDPPTLNA
jgi:hypothetical protein